MPANIFLFAFYSESLFVMLSLAGIYFYHRRRKLSMFVCFFLACFGKNKHFFFFFCISCIQFLFVNYPIVRSNAILYAGYFIYPHFLAFVVGGDSRIQKRISNVTKTCFVFLNYLNETIQLLIDIVFCLALFIPLYLMHYYVQSIYCENASATTSYCNDKLLPTFYTYIQKHYWYRRRNIEMEIFLIKLFFCFRNQGLFNYWTLKQLPNFALATPMFVLCFTTIYTMCRTNNGANDNNDDDENKQRRIIVTRRTSAAALASQSSASIGFITRRFLQREYAPHVILLALQCIVSLLSSHVQTHTRFVASSPVIYLCAARIAAESGKLVRFAVVLYFVQYSIIGTVLFNSFYPWT